MIRSPLLGAEPRLGHAHSTRADGAVGRLAVPGAPEARAALVLAAGGGEAAPVVAEQVHGARVAVATGTGAAMAATDALVTMTSGVPLVVQGADCPLLALFDPAARVAAVAHSGWRGTVMRIAAETVAAMRTLDAVPSGIRAAVFPGICPRCFEVGPEVEDAFVATFGARSERWFTPGKGDRRLLDLHAAIVATLLDAGLSRDRIDAVPGCTACGQTFFSHRASRGGPERHGLCVTLLS